MSPTEGVGSPTSTSHIPSLVFFACLSSASVVVPPVFAVESSTGLAASSLVSGSAP